ncbi:MAG TPA: XRE family transcriptional regulator [Bryobacteraceae bacterium]|nr:XRE family transcriptional regulator [Bryobacteraceae bacterium]
MPRKSFRELEKKTGPARIAASDARVRKMIEEMPLQRLRSARALTQEHLAHIMKKDQSGISQLERRTDMYVSTLADFVRAMGGELEIRANFPDGTVRLTGLADKP